MGSLDNNEVANLRNDHVYVGVIDKLREYGMADTVSLPQLVAVGDQSSGKSSLLESITGFTFPRASSLCTRYATQITCSRDSIEGIDISIIPGPEPNEARRERLRSFKRSLKMDELALAQVFAEANEAMGIRSSVDDAASSEHTTFSEDILKIEISGPTQQHLTVIDVPGIFRNTTENLTTEEDIVLVRNMVKRYIADQRTVILAVVPCNVDITTQEVLKLARDADPYGLRTLGVLTKPDLVTERATQNDVCDLVRGKKHALRLGYYVVKNRGSDETDHDDSEDGDGSGEGKNKRKEADKKRNDAERAFFSAAPWSALNSTKRVGIQSLAPALQDLLRAVTKKEFKNVTVEVDAALRDRTAELEQLGESRDDASLQRRYLGRVSNEFQTIAESARHNQYGRPLFASWNLRLVTRVVRLMEDFDDAMRTKGHTRNFEVQRAPEIQVPSPSPAQQQTAPSPAPQPAANATPLFGSGPVTQFAGKTKSQFTTGSAAPQPATNTKPLYMPSATLQPASTLAPQPSPSAKPQPLPRPPLPSFTYKVEDLLEDYPELDDIVKEAEYKCPEPRDASLMKHIEKIYNDSRGVGLGTFSEAILAEVFKEQTKKWKPLVLSYVSRAILIVHDFIARLLEEVCPDTEVYWQLMDMLLRDKLRAAYRRAMAQTELLLSIERHGQLMTMNPSFNRNVQKAQGDRLLEALSKAADPAAVLFGSLNEVGNRMTLPRAAIAGAVADRTSAEQARQEIHDILHSYYEVARTRFVDVISQQVVFHLLLDADDSPLRIFNPDLVMMLDDTQLAAIAGEDAVTRGRREHLVSEVEGLKKAAKAVRLGAR